MPEGLSKPFAFAYLSRLVQAPACERLLRALKKGIALVYTSSTSAPEVAAVLRVLQLLGACNGH